MQRHWESILELCEGYRELHAAQTAYERRASSWSRTLSFSQAVLGARGQEVRRGTPKEPFVFWVLGATDSVEAALAEEGFFADANWLDRAPTEVIIFGDQLRGLSLGKSAAFEGEPPIIRTAGYEAVRWLRETRRPDIAAILMPEARGPGEPPSGRAVLPKHVLEAVVDVPVVVSTRLQYRDKAAQSLLSLRNLLVLPQVRCPFSSAAGDPTVQHADNGWIFAVQGPDAVAFILGIEVRLAPPEPLAEQERIPTVFWGIFDLKYDDKQPILERVRVLETGDGRTSKFSGDGAGIAQAVQDRYQVEEGPMSRKYRVISADKKLTHDLMQLAGYGHMVPEQASFPRTYDPQLVDRIVEALRLRESDKVVLKLCNRSRAAGVLVVPVDELDDVLEELLSPPQHPEAWFQDKLKRFRLGSAVDFGFEWGSFEEQSRHWWSNESPNFLVERWCTSTPTERDGMSFDGTMRVGFALRRRGALGSRGAGGSGEKGKAPAGGSLPLPEELEVEWLGGYWKLPKGDLASSSGLRERVVSAARTSGTAPVRLAHLLEVYAALGDAAQRLFGGAEPSAKMLAEQYRDQPALAAYLTARLAVSNRDPGKIRKMLYDAQVHACLVQPGQERSCIESFISRGNGVLEARQLANKAANWEHAQRHFQVSVKHLPTNANSLFLLGMASLELGKPEEAVELMSKSLLLDPDFKAPYVNLGVAYLRLQEYERVLEVSDACLARHPQSPQCHYHVGVACCQLAFFLEAREAGGVRLLAVEALEYEELRGRAVEALREARESEEGRKRRPTGAGDRGSEPPWLEVDSRMVEAMSVLGRPTVGPEGEPLRGKARHVELPQKVGWRLLAWRT